MNLVGMITVVETSDQCKYFITQDRINNHVEIFYGEEKSSEVNREGHEIEGSFAFTF